MNASQENLLIPPTTIWFRCYSNITIHLLWGLLSRYNAISGRKRVWDILEVINISSKHFGFNR
jgi:hypothetical protein